jgi:DNA-binding transcriptional regulator YhcF (GntR family)
MKLNFVSETPLHKQVHLRMVNDISCGIYSQHSRLPSVKRLSAEYLVSTITIEKAYRSLLKEGLVSYIKGKGYFVIAGGIVVKLILNRKHGQELQPFYSD